MAGQITFGLLYDVEDVLKRHGFTQPEDELKRGVSHADTAVALLRLVEAFEGREGGQ